MVQENAMPSLSFKFCICITPIMIDQLLCHFFAALFLCFSAIYEAEIAQRN